MIVALQDFLCRTHREIGEVVIMRCEIDQPLAANVGDGANVILRRQHEFVVHHPLGLAIQAGGRVQHNLLVVLDGEVTSTALEVRDLHEIPAQDCLANVGVVISRCKVSADERQVEALANAHELRANIVGALHRSVADVVVPTPVGIFFRLLVRVIDVEQGEVIAVDVRKLSLGGVGLFGLISRANEAHGHREHRHDG